MIVSTFKLEKTIQTKFFSVLALDAMDSSGEQHLEISHNIYKRRLDLNGNALEEPKRENITIKIKSDIIKVFI